MKVGDLVKYKKRYIGQMFVVLEIRESQSGSMDKKAKCMRVLPPDAKHTKWSDIATIEVLNEV